jgi:phosphopentomutase
MARLMLLIIDGLGCGAQEDSHEYGDANANTLKHVVDTIKPHLPNFRAMGLGNIIALDHLSPIENPTAAFGKMRERSAGKDSTTGHWEMAGIMLETAFPTFPDGFPESVVEDLKRITGCSGMLCNKPYSGSEVIRDFGLEHIATGNPILYTSADSVLQIATHVDVTPLDTLYDWCSRIRAHFTDGDFAVGRVIARPFAGDAPPFYRLSDHRHDYSLLPPEPNLLSNLQLHGVKTQSIGKVVDLFAGHGFDHYHKTEGNADGLDAIVEWWRTSDPDEHLFQFVNLIDTDQLYGHRNDPDGYARCLEEIDQRLPEILGLMKEGDVLMITGDHGNDPTTPGTDHTREFVPLLVYPSFAATNIDLGTLDGFGELANASLAFFGFVSTSESILSSRQNRRD